jgi:hypothetical protein
VPPVVGGSRAPRAREGGGGQEPVARPPVAILLPGLGFFILSQSGRVARANRAMARATLTQDDREAMGAKAKSGYSRYGDIHRRHGCACVSGRKRCFCWHGTRLRRRSS